MTISTAALPYVLAPSSAIVFINLLTISLEGYDTLYVANNNENVISRGITFLASQFAINLPRQTNDKMPDLSITINNVDRSLIEFIRGLPKPPNIQLEVVTNVDTDTVEMSVGFMRLVNVHYDALQITGQLSIDNMLSRKFGETYLPKTYPGLFPV